jgi:hypothetical protein
MTFDEQPITLGSMAVQDKAHDDRPGLDIRLMRIRGRLDGLTARAALPRYREINGQRPVFGSNGHRWHTERQTPEALRELAAFLGTDLPQEFHRFLSTLGSGAGPHYGIWSPPEIREEVQLDRDNCASDKIEPPHSERPLPITVTQVRDALAPTHPYPLDGAVRICHQGCGTWTALGLTGTLAGTVWDVDCHCGDWDDAAEWWPATYPAFTGLAGKPVYFLDWYEAWLDVSEAALGAPA